MNKIVKVVLTGGPCAGKTTALVRIIEHFTSLGYKVFTIPEVPTLYSQGGWNYLTPNRQLYYEGERAILSTQLALEDSFMRLASLPTVVVLPTPLTPTTIITVFSSVKEYASSGGAIISLMDSIKSSRHSEGSCT